MSCSEFGTRKSIDHFFARKYSNNSNTIGDWPNLRPTIILADGPPFERHVMGLPRADQICHLVVPVGLITSLLAADNRFQSHADMLQDSATVCERLDNLKRRADGLLPNAFCRRVFFLWEALLWTPRCDTRCRQQFDRLLGDILDSRRRI